MIGVIEMREMVPHVMYDSIYQYEYSGVARDPH